MSKPRSASPADVEWHAKRLDPNKELPEAERYRRAESERKAYFKSLALKSATAARHRRELALQVLAEPNCNTDEHDATESGGV